MPQFGAHMSIAGGMHRALERGKSVGCDVVQVFTRNNNRWHSPDLADAAIDKWQEALVATAILPSAAHGSYLVNLASPDDNLWEQSVQAVVCEMSRCLRLSIPQYVLHPGAHIGSGADAGTERIVAALNRVFAETPSTRLLVETTAGQGTSIGHTFEELVHICERVTQADRIGVCLDTAHIFAAGYDLRTAEDYDSTIAAFDHAIGIDRLGLVHLNDSKRELGSQVDRHAHIGRGAIGLEAFWRLVNDDRLERVPMVLETPKDKTLVQDKWSLGILRALVGASEIDMQEIADEVLENGPG